MTRISGKLSTLALGILFAAVACNCNSSPPPGAATVAFTSPTAQETLGTANGTVSDGILTITVTGTVSGFTTSPLCNLFVDGNEVQKNVAAVLGVVTFPNVALSGGTPATPHTLKIVCTDVSNQTGSAGPITVDVLIGSTGSCGLTIAPPNSTVFNESGAQVGSHFVVKDSNTGITGMQATITVTMNQDGGACPDGIVTLAYGDGGTSPQPAPVQSVNGQAIFNIPTLPETTAAALGDVTKQLAVTASVDSSSISAHYIVDSVDPSCTITSPVDGATITLADDLDSSTSGIQINVTGTCTGLAGTTPPLTLVNGANGGATSQCTTAADGTFSCAGVTVASNGALSLTGNSVTGNPITSSTSNITVNNVCPMPSLAFKSPTPNQSLNLSADESGNTPGLQIPISFTADAGNGATVQVCSTVAPVTGAATCPFGSTPAFVVTGTNPTASVNNGAATLDQATLGDDGAAASQTLTAQVMDPCGTATASVAVAIHALQPVIESIKLLNAFTDSDGGLWLNASTLSGGAATTTVEITVDNLDNYDAGTATVSFGPSGPHPTGAFAGTAPPTSDVLAALGDGTYAVKVTATDSWGNSSDTNQTQPVPVTFPLMVKTTLPSCTITAPDPTTGCFNVADHGNVEAAGAVFVPIVVTAQNASAADINGATLNGTATVTNAAGPTSDPISNVVTVSPSSAQGANSYSATVTDPAGNPPATCSPAALNVNVSTQLPTLTVAPQGGGAVDAQKCLTYTVRDGIVIDVTTTDLADGTSITIQGTGPNGGATAKTPATVTTNAASATLNGLPNGDDTVTANGTDSCGNNGSGTACIGVTAPGCDLSLVSPIPTLNGSTESVVFNASQVDTNGNASVELHTSCAQGTQVQFDSTPSGGSDTTVTTGVDAQGNVTFQIASLVDGSTGTFTADIAGGAALPTIDYDAKLSLPDFSGEMPAAGNLEIVANQDNLILSDAGVTSLAVDGGTILANEAQCLTTSCADFTLSGITGLGPVDGSGNIGAATLTLSFPGQTTSNPGAISIASGSTSVTFTAVTLPAVATGTVTLTLADNVGNTKSETWNVNADGIQPPSPVLSASMSDKRIASVGLTWTNGASNGDSAIAGYELAYVVNDLQATPPATPSEAVYATWTLDPTIAGVTGNSHTVTPLPTLNQYTFELRAIDAVGNRSALAADATAMSISASDSNAWQTLVLTDSAAADVNSDFGYVIRTGDFDNDGKKDLVITAPYQYAGPNTPGIVYILKGNTAANLATATFANLTPISLGGTQWDYFGQDAWVADFNGDGTDDLAVGAPNYNNGQGRVDIFFGGAGGIAVTPSTTILGDSTASGQFGFSITASDVNGDGIKDLIVGAPAMGASNNGASYVFLSSKNWALPDAGVDVTSATSVITGKAGDVIGARWGNVNLSDIDGDKDEDFAVAAPGGGGTDGLDGGSGIEYGISGKTATTNATIDLTTATPLFTLVGRAGGFCDPQGWGYASGGFWDCFGEAAIGDVSFTGGALPDLVVSSGYYNAIYLYSMAKTGPVTPPVFSDAEDGAVGGTPGWQMVATDLNGDGHPDLLIGQNNSSSPNVYLYLNTGTGLATPPSAELLGPTSSYFGYAVGAGDLQGIGKQDFAISDCVNQYVNVYY